MATIEKRKGEEGGTCYRVKIRLRGYPSQSASFKRLTDAKRWAQQTEAAMREGRYFKTAEAKRRTLAELIDRYLRDFVSERRDAKDRTRQLLWWKREAGAYLLSDITPALIGELRDRLKNGYTVRNKLRSPATVNRYLAALSHALKVAVDEWGWLDDTPMRKVGKLKESRGRVRYLSEDEIGQDGQVIPGERSRLIQACRQSKSRYLYPVVVTALSTGMRRGEIMGLHWSDVDLRRGSVVLHETKNGERRSVPLAGHALEVFKAQCASNAERAGLVFPSRQDPSKPTDIEDAWQKALERAEVQDFHFHDLRHSAASYLAMNGATLTEIAEILGHKTLEMVKRYSHLSETHTASVVAKMNQRIFNSQE